MTATQALPLAVTAFLALASWAALRQFGGRGYRQYAVPVAAAILIFGVDYVFDLPTWSYLIAILVTPFIYHRSVKSRLAAAARAINDVKAEADGVRLILADDITGTHAAAWRIAPLEGSGAPAGLPLVKLELQGEVEDEYQVLLWAPVRPFRPVSLVIHHKDAETLAGKLTKAPALDLSGAPSWLIARAEPFDFGLLLLDRPTLAFASTILELRGDEREVAIQLDGGATRVVSSKTLDEEELRTLLRAFATWQARVCAALVNFRPIHED